MLSFGIREMFNYILALQMYAKQILESGLNKIKGIVHAKTLPKIDRPVPGFSASKDLRQNINRINVPM
jgi:hypothetical protein